MLGVWRDPGGWDSPQGFRTRDRLEWTLPTGMTGTEGEGGHPGMVQGLRFIAVLIISVNTVNVLESGS